MRGNEVRNITAGAKAVIQGVRLVCSVLPKFGWVCLSLARPLRAYIVRLGISDIIAHLAIICEAAKRVLQHKAATRIGQNQILLVIYVWHFLAFHDAVGGALWPICSSTSLSHPLLWEKSYPGVVLAQNRHVK